MKISIGVLAYNEESTIAQTLNSLFQQSIFQGGQPDEVEIVVVPNGCTDATAAIAQATLQTFLARLPQTQTSQLSYKTCPLSQAGKSNAWNFYVHEFSDPNAEYLILMDADIQFLNPHTLHELIEGLQQDSQAWVSVGIPIKDVALKPQKNLFERLSVAVSKSPEDHSAQANPDICGQLYCGRTTALRNIWMPIGLPVEDGFLRAVVCTEGFTMPEGTYRRIKLVRSATHVFEAYTRVTALLNHEKRLLIGSVINAFLYDYLWKNCNPQQPAGFLIQQRNSQDPNWLAHLLQKSLAKQGWWVIPSAFSLRRWHSLRQYSISKKILRLSLVVAASVVDWFVCLQANIALKRGEGLGYWGTKQRVKELT